jgi:hypothetical protein
MEFRILWLNFVTCIGYKNLSAAPHVNVIALAPISNASVCDRPSTSSRAVAERAPSFVWAITFASRILKKRKYGQPWNPLEFSNIPSENSKTML